MTKSDTNNGLKFQTITLTQGEIQDAMKHRVHKSKKAYTRKNKHKGREF